MRVRRALVVVFVAAAALPGLAAPAGGVPIAADPPVTIASGMVEPRSVTTGDMDGDGDLDVVGTAQISNEVAWFENGAAWAEHAVGARAGAQGVAVGDVSGDGQLDIVVAAIGPVGGDRIDAFINDGGGATFTAWEVDLASDDAFAVDLGDIDSDGDLDIVGTAASGDTVDWYENAVGDGTAWVEDNIGVIDNAWSVDVGDVDGDGDLDVAVGSRSSSTFGWFEDTSAAHDGSSWSALHTIPASGIAVEVALGDLDGDGDLDLAATRSGFGTTYWYENDAGTGLAWTERNLVGESFNIVVADVDTDGDLDIQVTTGALASIIWFDNDGEPEPTFTPRTLRSALGYTQAVAVADVDGDGDVDTIVGIDDIDGYALLDNRTIHSTIDTPPDVTVAATGLDGAIGAAVADLDGDGDQDVAVTSFFDDTLRWLENTTGDGSAFTPRTIVTTLDGAGKVITTDIDGDGDQDIVANAAVGDDVRWYENDGGADPTFADAGSVLGAETVDGPQVIDAADIDRDGDMDLLSNSGAGEVLYHVNAGDGSAWSVSDSWGGISFASGLAAADGDGNGTIDLVWGSAGAGTVSWQSGDGTPAYDPPVLVAAVVEAGIVEVADVDGDGDVDVLSSSSTGDTVQWHSNDGDPSDGGWVTVPIGSADGPQGIATGDIDHDGDLDVMTISPTDGLVLFENTAGDGSAWTEVLSLVASADPDDVALGDLDGDGDLDAVVPSLTDDTVRWYETELHQVALVPTDTSPATVDAGDEVAMLSMTASHLGDAVDHDAELTGLGVRLESTTGDPLTPTEADALLTSLDVYVEDGAAGFDGTEPLLTSIAAFPVDGAGELTITVPDVAGAVVPFGADPTFHLVAVFDTSGDFEVTVRPSESTFEDDEATIAVPLRVRDDGDATASVAGVGGGGGGGGGDDRDPAPSVGRRGGVDRFATAVAMSSDLEPGVETVYVATGLEFPDALASGPIAGLQGAALLLVTHDAIPDVTVSELRRLRPGRIVVVGGTAAIDDVVLEQLRAFTDGAVVRIAGDDRYGTAAALARHAFPSRVPVVHLVNGESFADAVATGPAAAAAGGPILLVTHDGVPAVTADELVRLAPGSVVLVGGTGVIDPRVEGVVRALLPLAAITRIAGATRYATAAALAETLVDERTDRVFVATGEDFVDALTATPRAVRDGTTIVLVPSSGTLPPSVRALLDDAPDASVTIVGGTAAVSDSMEDQLRD